MSKKEHEEELNEAKREKKKDRESEGGKKKSKWKIYLLRSGLPLEYESANLLVSNHYVVSADYKYMRKGVVKSVDLRAIIPLPYDVHQQDEIGKVNMLVECKYRHPNTKWLFFRDPNRPSASEMLIGYTIRVIDEFSPYRVSREEINFFDSNIDRCYKGTEIKYNGQVDDSELKDGIDQIQYGLPNLCRQTIIPFVEVNGYTPIILICPILLTTADLFIAKQGLTMDHLRDAKEIGDISVKVPYFMYFSDYGADFEQYCSDLFRISSKQYASQIKIIKRKRQKLIDSGHSLDPVNIAKGLFQANWIYLRRYFVKFIVCNFFEFQNLLTKFKEIFSKTIKSSKKVFEPDRESLS
ncbi:MAG: hypothetical protein HWN66_06160 [Candidatus Helarchaeota archaeon]|nr:hypothetical protein [Candidatus Helarchaeota archaeon]